MRHLPILYALISLTTAGDLIITTTTARNCSRPTRSGDSIHVHYRGTLASNGFEFDSSYSRNQPFSFSLGWHQVIEGWDQGLLDMCPGEERKLEIPPEMAYGDRGAPPRIPGGATLVFETKLISIDGVKEEVEEAAPVATSTESLSATSTSGGSHWTTINGWVTIATAPATNMDENVGEDLTLPKLEGEPLTGSDAVNVMAEGECHLLGPFALIVQAALGAVALLSLVYKRWREEYKRPWRIWFFDVSKQVLGSMLTHVLNLMMSMLGSVDMMSTMKKAAAAVSADGSADGGGKTMPNPCSFYLLNLGIDTTIGIPVLFLLLKVLHHAFFFTPLANPPESIKSGHYGHPPHATWWLKQSLIYFLGLTGMKLFVWSLFALLPWLPWVGDWALRWTEGNERLEVAFAMFIFPLAMNAVQYWIIDNIIAEKGRGKDGAGDYERVRQSGETADEDAETEVEVEDSIQGKTSEDGSLPPLKEVNPSPLEDQMKGQSSRGPSPHDET